MPHQRHMQNLNLAVDDLYTIAPLNIAGLVRIVWYGKWIILAAITGCLLIAGYYGFHVALPKYAATATLQIDPRQADLQDVGDYWPPPSTDVPSLNTQMAIMTSDQILAAVVSAEGLLQDPEFNRYLQPASPISLGSLRVRVRQWIAGTVEGAPDSAAITHKTIENLRAALSVQQPKDTHIFQISVSSADPDKAAQVTNAVAQAYLDHQSNTRQRAADTAVAWLSARAAELWIELQQQEQAITRLIASAQVQEEGALDTLSRAVMQIDDDRSTTLAALAAYDARPTSLRQNAQIAQLQDQLATLDARRSRLNLQLRRQSAGLAVLQQSQREADATRILHQSAISRLQTAQAQRGLAYPDSHLIAPATKGKYLGPRKVLLLQAAALVGALLGLLVLAALHLSRKGFDHPDQLRQATGLPVIASLTKHASRYGPNLAGFSDTGQGRALSLRLESSMALIGRGRPPTKTLVTASVYGEGHAALGYLIACSFAQIAPTVLLLADATNSSGPVRSNENLSIIKGVSITALCDPQQWASLAGSASHVVVVGPPVQHCPSTLRLSAQTDSIALAVRWASTCGETLADTVDQINAASNAPVGVALTHVRRRKLRQLGKAMGRRVLHRSELA